MMNVYYFYDHVELPPLCIKVIDTPQFQQHPRLSEGLKGMIGVLDCEMRRPTNDTDGEAKITRMLLTTECIHDVFDRS